MKNQPKLFLSFGLLAAALGMAGTAGLLQAQVLYGSLVGNVQDPSVEARRESG